MRVLSSSEDSAIVFDVTESASVYWAAISIFCNNTPDFTSDNVSASVQPLIDQFHSRSLLKEIGYTGVARIDDGTKLESEGKIVEVCVYGDVAVRHQMVCSRQRTIASSRAIRTLLAAL